MSDSLPVDRRRFLKVLGVAGAGAAAASACGIGPEPTERLIPYLIQPEDQIPGTATYYATTCRECAAGCGVRVRVREGRAVKLEGNPDSPINRGRLCARAQAFDAGRPASMSKFVYVGPRLSLTGMNADEWIAARPGTEGLLALALAQVIVARHLARLPADASRLSSLLAGYAPRAVAATIGIDEDVIVRLAREFAISGGGLAVAGGMATQGPNGAEIAAAVNILNYAAGAVGTLVKFGADLAIGSTHTFGDLTALMADMAAGKVALLFVHGTNPAYSVPGAFQQALGKVGYKVSFSSYMDETTAACDLILPDHHSLEQWGDSRPRAGVTALQQPVVQPVFDTRPTGDVILKLSGKTGTFEDYLQGKWRAKHATNFDQYWMDSLAKGGIYTQAPTRAVRLAPSLSRISFAAPAASGGQDQDVIVFPHPILHDGRGANKPWLQELPDPVSKIAWHSWVEVHPDTAAKWGLATGDFILLKSSFGAQKFPAWITRSVRPDVLAVPTGQGHTAYGRYAKDRSANAFELLGAQANDYGGRNFGVRASATKTGEHRKIVTTEGGPRELGLGTTEVLPLARAKALHPGDHPFHFEETPEYAKEAVEWWGERQHEKASIGNYRGEHPRWGLAIDAFSCWRAPDHSTASLAYSGVSSKWNGWSPGCSAFARASGRTSVVPNPSSRGPPSVVTILRCSPVFVALARTPKLRPP